jgi:acetyl-CoA carboxylase beta subunit
METQLEFLSNYIDEKLERVNSINEDENLKELIDKTKMKEMQQEIKLLEKKKVAMEKVYEKMCGKAYQRAEIVDEIQSEDE